MHTKRVLLVKEPRSASSSHYHDDPYYVALAAAGYAVAFLPALAHRWSNLEELRACIAAGSKEQYSGVVFTSQRAVEAWQEAWKGVDEKPDMLGWPTIPFYIVGPATARMLATLPKDTVPPSHLILGADESGNAAKLADFIVSRQSTHEKPLLYLVGDKRKDTLSTLLGQAGMSVQELQVYETYPCPTFAEDARRMVASNPFDWIVFFSPSGAKLLLPLLDHIPRIAAIGPTTLEYLQSVPKVSIPAVADSPTPESLVDAIIAADRESAPAFPS